METHVAYMVVHLPAYQYPFPLAFSADERMASIAQNAYPDAYPCALNGCFFTKVAWFV